MVVFTRNNQGQWDFNTKELEVITTRKFATLVERSLQAYEADALAVNVTQMENFIFIDIYTKYGLAKLVSDNGNYEQVTFTMYSDMARTLDKARELGVF